MKSFLIIGMGSFGHHLCREFSEMKCELMVVDKDADALEDVLAHVTSAKIGDCTRKNVLESFDIHSFDACFVCIGNDFESSLQITSLLKELGANRVFSKADRDIQEKFLRHNGADFVIYPEKDTAHNIALQEISDSIFDVLTLTEDYMICEIQPRKDWIGKTAVEINMRRKYRLSLLAAKRGDTVIPMPGLDYRFREDEHVIVLGHVKDIQDYAY